MRASRASEPIQCGNSSVTTYPLTPRIIVVFVLAVFALLSHSPSALGQVGVIGYINSIYYPGTNLIANPVDNGTNDLATLFWQPPDGTTVSLWDPFTRLQDRVLGPSNACRENGS